jgi:hypothetical protein
MSLTTDRQPFLPAEDDSSHKQLSTQCPRLPAKSEVHRHKVIVIPPFHQHGCSRTTKKHWPFAKMNQTSQNTCKPLNRGSP